MADQTRTDFPTSGVVYLAIAFLAIVAAFATASMLVLPVVLIGLACFLAICARMVQAGAQHREVMTELRRRSEPGV